MHGHLNVKSITKHVPNKSGNSMYNSRSKQNKFSPEPQAKWDLYWRDTKKLPVISDLYWRDTKKLPVISDLYWRDTKKLPVISDFRFPVQSVCGLRSSGLLRSQQW